MCPTPRMGMFFMLDSPVRGLSIELHQGQTTSCLENTLVMGMPAGNVSFFSRRIIDDPGSISMGLLEIKPPPMSHTPMAAVGVP